MVTSYLLAWRPARQYCSSPVSVSFGTIGAAVRTANAWSMHSSPA